MVQRPMVFATPLRVLVVDEHTLFRCGLVQVLRDWFRPLELVEAADLNEAELGLTSLGRVDVVLMDPTQCTGDGRDDVRHCRALAPGAAVIALADRAPPETVSLLLGMGVDGLIDKTAQADAVAGVVAEVLTTHSPALHPALASDPRVPAPARPRPSADQAIQVPHVIARSAPGTPPSEPARGSTSAGLQDDMEAFGLSARQIDVMTLLADGLSNKAISRQLGVAESTVKTHVIGLYQKLGVATRTEAVLAISQRGWRQAPSGGRA